MRWAGITNIRLEIQPVLDTIQARMARNGHCMDYQPYRKHMAASDTPSIKWICLTPRQVALSPISPKWKSLLFCTKRFQTPIHSVNMMIPATDWELNCLWCTRPISWNFIQSRIYATGGSCIIQAWQCIRIDYIWLGVRRSLVRILFHQSSGPSIIWVISPWINENMNSE